MIKNELYRIFIKQRFILILIVLWAVKIISIINSPVYINTEIEQLHKEYTTYISQYEGKYSQSAEQIYDDYNDIVKAGEELSILFGQLDNKEINADTYKEKTAELNKCMQRSKLVTLAKEELDYVKESPQDRWVMYINGWEAFMAKERLDYTLVIAVVFLVLILFVFDTELGVASLTLSTVNGRSKAYFSKQLILIVFIISASLILLGTELIYFAVKYGLPCMNAPIQSLISFRESPLNISIVEGVLMMTFFRIIGYTLLAQITVLISEASKKLWIAAVISGGIIFIPFAILNGKKQRFFFQPLGMILGNGYLKGDCGPLTTPRFIFISEPFEGVSVNAICIMTAATIVLSFLMFHFSLNIRINGIRKSAFSKTVTAILLSIILIAAFPVYKIKNSSADTPTDWNTVFSSRNVYYDDKFFYTSAFTNTLSAFSRSDKKSTDIIRDVMRNHDVTGYYVDDNYVYYIQKNQSSGELRYYKLDKNDYSETLIFRETKGSRMYEYNSKYLGLINVKNIENVSIDDYAKDDVFDFWIDGEYIFTVDHNGVNMININEQTSERIIECSMNTEAVACINGVIYYGDRLKNLYSFDINSRVTKNMDFNKCSKLFVAANKLIVVDLDFNIRIYDEKLKIIPDIKIGISSDISSVGNKIVFADDRKLPVAVDITDNSVDTLITDITAYNVEVFDDLSEIYVFYEKEDEFISSFVKLK